MSTTLAVETDTALADLYGAMQQVDMKIESETNALRSMAGQNKNWVSRSRYTWTVSRKDWSPATLVDALTFCRTYIADNADESDYARGCGSWSLGQVRGAVAGYDAALVRRAEIIAEH